MGNLANFKIGLNFDAKTAAQGVEYAHRHGRRGFVALNTFPEPSDWERWRAAVDRAAELGVDAIIAADISVLDYACRQHPHLRLRSQSRHPDRVAARLKSHTPSGPRRTDQERRLLHRLPGRL